MNKQKRIEQATNDLKLIRQVIEKTAVSFVSFSNIFIYWGLLYLGLTGVAYIINSVFHLYTNYSWLNHTLFPLFLITAFYIFKKVSREKPLQGLSKQIMYIWLYIFLLNFLLMVIQAINPEWLLFSFSIGLYSTSILTNFKFPLYLAFIYVGLGIFQQIDTSATLYILNGIYPFTFLALGLYLMSFKGTGRR